MVVLVCKDGTIDTRAAPLNTNAEPLKVSSLINDMLMDEDDNENIEIPIGSVDCKTMYVILEFLFFHRENPFPTFTTPITTNDLSVILKGFDWDLAFIDRIDEMPMAAAAKYLGIVPLFNLCCLKMAAKIKDKSPKEIRKMYSLAERTPEQHRQLCQNSAWLFGDAGTKDVAMKE